MLRALAKQRPMRERATNSSPSPRSFWAAPLSSAAQAPSTARCLAYLSSPCSRLVSLFPTNRASSPAFLLAGCCWWSSRARPSQKEFLLDASTPIRNHAFQEPPKHDIQSLTSLLRIASVFFACTQLQQTRTNFGQSLAQRKTNHSRHDAEEQRQRLFHFVQKGRRCGRQRTGSEVALGWTDRSGPSQAK